MAYVISLDFFGQQLRKESSFMAASKKHKHLTLEDRSVIEDGIAKNQSKAEIARRINKDSGTVAKEIKRHRYPEEPYGSNLKLDCTRYQYCKHLWRCTTTCCDYKPFSCHRRDVSPGACNGCSEQSKCRHMRYRYDAVKAQKSYESLLVAARLGVDLDEVELVAIAEIVVPCVKNGQAPYAIVKSHPELGISEKTLYNWIARDIFKPFGLTILDLRQSVRRRKPPKHKDPSFKKRADRKHLVGRTYDHYIAFCGENVEACVVQMDTVYNRSQGPFLQTFLFIPFNFFFAIYHEKNNSQSMVQGINWLEEFLGEDLFERYVQVLLTDRGSEFADAFGMEFREDGTQRTRVFYCDAMSSGQKGAFEKRHTLLRYCLPKGKDLKQLGLLGQRPLNLILSHLNSYCLESCGGKTPWQILEFMAPDLALRFQTIGLQIIEPKDVKLNPSVLK